MYERLSVTKNAQLKETLFEKKSFYLKSSSDNFGKIHHKTRNHLD